MKRFLKCICPFLVAAGLIGLILRQEAEAAPTYFTDDFQDGNADGWTVQAGDWDVLTETANSVSYRVVYTGASPGSRRAFYDTVDATSWDDYYIEANVMVESTTASNRWGMLMVRWQDSGNYYYLALEGDGDLKIREYNGGSSNNLGSTSAGLELDTWYKLGLEVFGDTTTTLRAFLDGTPVLTVTDSASPHLTGPCALGSYESTSQFDNVVVKDIGGFNTLMSEDFDDYTADDWTEQAGYWEMNDYSFDNYYYRVFWSVSDPSPGSRRSYRGSPSWTDYSISGRMMVESTTASNRWGMFMVRWQDSKNYYYLAFEGDGDVKIREYNNGSSNTLGTANLGLSPDTWYTLALEVIGTSPTMRAYLDGTPVLTVTDTTGNPHLSGQAALGSYESTSRFDDVVVSDLRVFTLTASTMGSGEGIVTSDIGDIDCGATCEDQYMANRLVTLTATPTGTATFAGWMGGCTGTDDCDITMDSSKSVVAVFSSVTDPMLVVNKGGNGTGTVTSDPGGIDCGGTCAISYTASTVVTLTATPDPENTFTGWSGDCSGMSTTCVVTMTTSMNVTANFFQDPLLTVTKDGNGSGSVTSDPAGIDCGITCTKRFVPATVVTMTATPSIDSVFTGWSGGGCSGTGTCTVTMNDDTNVNATFTLITYTLTVNRAGNGMGSTLSDPAGINNCSNITCTAIFDIGTVVTSTATANPASYFAGWSGEGCSGTDTCTVTMDADRMITATFSSYRVYLPLVSRGTGATTAQPDFGMVGYATVSALGQNVTTGGEGGAVVTVSSLTDLETYAEAAGTPYIIQISGLISDTGRVRVASDKTIVGLGSDAELRGVWLSIDEGVSNVIIRNLKISKVVGYDAIHIQGPNTHHVWIDHCDLSSDDDHHKDYYDGLIDITHAVDYVTISWTKLHDHWKTSLIGHNDNNSAEDAGHFLITYHHNYFYNVNSRLPSNRFGSVHSFNNFFDNSNKSPVFDANSAISSRMGACTRIENNYFVGFGDAVRTDQSSLQDGEVELLGNVFVDCTSIDTTPTCTLTLPYSYATVLNDAVGVPSIVAQYSGTGVVSDPLSW